MQSLDYICHALYFLSRLFRHSHSAPLSITRPIDTTFIKTALAAVRASYASESKRSFEIEFRAAYRTG